MTKCTYLYAFKINNIIFISFQFLQILLVSTMLYGVGWNQGQIYNVTPDNLGRYQHFRAIAFFFAGKKYQKQSSNYDLHFNIILDSFYIFCVVLIVWALQSVALALLLVWAIGKVTENTTIPHHRSHMLSC